MVLNGAAHLVVGDSRYEDITPALCDMLHWLPVPHPIQFKIAISALTVSVSTVLPTSSTSVSQLPAFLVGQIFVWQNATTCLSFQQEHSSADGVSTLQPQPSGTRFHHSSAYHPLLVDSLQLGWKPISSRRPMDTSENFCWRAYYFTFTFTWPAFNFRCGRIICLSWLLMVYALRLISWTVKRVPWCPVYIICERWWQLDWMFLKCHPGLGL